MIARGQHHAGRTIHCRKSTYGDYCMSSYRSQRSERAKMTGVVSDMNREIQQSGGESKEHMSRPHYAVERWEAPHAEARRSR